MNGEETKAKIAQRVARSNTRLLWWFVKNKFPRRLLRRVGGHDGAVSELSVAYVDACHKWAERQEKHRHIKLATFVINNLIWEIPRVYARLRMLSVPHEWDTHDSVRSKREAALKVRYFHGGEGKCGDSALLWFDENESENDELIELVRLTASRLTQRQQLVIDLRYRDELTLQDAGTVMGGISKERVRQVLAKAERMFAAEWEKSEAKGIQP